LRHYFCNCITPLKTINSGSSRKSHQRKRKPAQENKVATPPEQKNPAKKARKPKKASTYVPLAVRENKKDAYYWYW
jgi:hypothetical protein